MSAADPFAPIRGHRPHPWPLGPVLDRIDPLREMKRAEQADALGMPITTYKVAFKHGGLTDSMADKVAIRMGLHPSILWGADAWIAAGLTPSDDLFVNGSATSGPGWRQAWDWHEASRQALHLAPIAPEAPETMREAA